MPNYTSHPLYNTWINAKQSGRKHDISMSERWLTSFESFASDIEKEIGPKPTPRHAFFRVDLSNGFEPGNVCWLTFNEYHRRETQRKKGIVSS